MTALRLFLGLIFLSVAIYTGIVIASYYAEGSTERLLLGKSRASAQEGH